MGNRNSGGNRSKAHTELVNAAFLELGKRNDLIVIKRDAGSARAMHNPKIVFEYGRPGEGDLNVFLAPNGRALWLEAKTGSAVQSIRQVYFSEYIRKIGGQYHVFHSVEEAVEIIERAER